MRKKDFTPSYDERTQQSYDARAKRCKKLRKGTEEYYEEGCKRDKHLMLAGGRSHLRYSKYGPYPKDKKEGGPQSQGKKESSTTARRLSQRLPPWDRRTQAPDTVREDRERRGRSFDRLVVRIETAIEVYRRASPRGRLGFLVPDTPWPLIEAGMPKKTAWILADRAPNAFYTAAKVSLPQANLLDQTNRAIGKLAFGGELGREVIVVGKERELGPLGALDLYVGGQRVGEITKEELAQQHDEWTEKVKSETGGRYRSREYDALLLKRIFLGIERIARPEQAWSKGEEIELNLWFPRSEEEFEVRFRDREHSKLVDKRALTSSVKYRTLENVDLSDLPTTLARLTRRKKREGRRLEKAKNNPMEDDALKTLILQQLQLGKFVGVPGKPGRVYWWSKGKGTIVETTQKRAETWLAIARTGKMAAHILSKDADIIYREEGLSKQSLKENPMSYHDDDWYTFEQYSKSPYGAQQSIPAARRNKKRRRKGTKKEREYMWASGKAEAYGAKKNRRRRKTTARQRAWQQEFGQISKLASRIQKQRGCSYKQAWDEARGQVGGRAAANPWYFGRGRGGGPAGSNLYLPDTTQVRPALVPAAHPWDDGTEIFSALEPGPYTRRNPTRREDEWLWFHESPAQRRKSKKRRGKARRNRGHSEAAEAMNLFHSGQAPSLKAAWRIVKGRR